jgi:hypothetical protein
LRSIHGHLPLPPARRRRAPRGGPPTYEGVDLREVRAATGEREFGALVSDVVATLDEHGIAPRDVDTVVGVLRTLRAGG